MELLLVYSNKCRNSQMIKNLGCKYVIVGHSENRSNGDNNYLINQKIKSSLSNNLNVLFCIGENIKEKKSKRTKLVLKKQLIKGLNKVKNIDKIIIAYEPVWSIGSGLVPKNKELISNIFYMRMRAISKYIFFFFNFN